MTEAGRAFRRTANRTGGALLLFTFLFWIFQLILILTNRLTAHLDPMPATVVYELVSAVGYAAAFIVPALFFKLLAGPQEYVSLRARFSLPSHVWAYLFVALAVNLTFAVVNAYLVLPFHYGEFMQSIEQTPATNYELVLALLTTAVVPAFVEELLFRGVILGNLMPFGRDTAIILSALAFGLMHQNAGQFLYTTVMGLVLGYIFVVSGNIWCGVLIHFVNNAFSVLWDVLDERMPAVVADPVSYAAEAAMFLLGAGAFLFLLSRRERYPLAAEPIPELPDTPLPVGQRMRLFLTSPTIVVFMVISGLEMIAILLLTLISGAL